MHSQGWAVEGSCYEGRWRLPSPLFFFSKMMTSPQRAVSFLSHAVGPGTSSKTISLSANTSLPQYILLLYSQRLRCGNRRPRQNGWSSATHSAPDGEDSVLWDGDNLFREASKCLGPERYTAGESACQAKHWPPAGKHLSYSGSIRNWSRPNCMYNVGCWAVKTGCLSDQCWERDMICPHPLKAYYGKGQRAFKRLSNEQRRLPVCSKWIPSWPDVFRACWQGSARPTDLFTGYATSHCFLLSRQVGGQKLWKGARHRASWVLNGRGGVCAEGL